MSEPCPFCDLQGVDPASILSTTQAVFGPGLIAVIRPLDPVTPGHLLVLPTVHVRDFATGAPPTVISTMRRAQEVAETLHQQGTDCNVITSVGPAATQTVLHLHVHVVPRVQADGLRLPWPRRLTPDECNTTGDGHEFDDHCYRCGVTGRDWFNR